MFSLVLLEVAKPGAMVKKGDVIAEFDRQHQLNRIDDYKAAVLQADANIRQVKANLSVTKEAHNQLIFVAKADLDKALLDQKKTEVVSSIDAERLQLAVDEARARHQQLLAEVKLVEISQAAQIRISEISASETKIQLQKAEANANRMVMKAPIDGMVVMEKVFRGGEFAQIQQGDQVYPGQLFMKIVDPSSMVINGTVNQVDAEALRINMKAQVSIDAYPGIELPAHVFSIGAISKPRMFRPNWVQDIAVRLKLDKMDAHVIPDLSASADIVLSEERQAAAVTPLGGVFREPSPDGKQPQIVAYVRNEEAATGWERRALELGLRSNTHAVVRAGLKAGEMVALQNPRDKERELKEQAEREQK